MGPSRNARRRRRIAAGSGTTVATLNSLLKRFGEMQKMMKKMGKFQKMMAKMGGGMGAMPGMGKLRRDRCGLDGACTNRRREGHGGNLGITVGFKDIRSNSGHVTYIVAHIIGNCCRISRVIFWNSSFYFTY